MKRIRRVQGSRFVAWPFRHGVLILFARSFIVFGLLNVNISRTMNFHTNISYVEELRANVAIGVLYREKRFFMKIKPTTTQYCAQNTVITAYLLYYFVQLNIARRSVIDDVMKLLFACFVANLGLIMF